MTNQNEAMLKMAEGALEYGIKVHFDEQKRGVSMHFYIDDPSKFKKDYYCLNAEEEAVVFEMKQGELIGTGGIGFYTTRESYPHSFKPTERYLTILPGIESEDDYIDQDDYNARFMDAGEVEPISLCDFLTTYFLERLNGYKGEFWQYIRPEFDDFHLYQ